MVAAPRGATCKLYSIHVLKKLLQVPADLETDSLPLQDTQSEVCRLEFMLHAYRVGCLQRQLLGQRELQEHRRQSCPSTVWYLYTQLSQSVVARSSGRKLCTPALQRRHALAAFLVRA